jgi:hypothetical protein
MFGLGVICSTHFSKIATTQAKAKVGYGVLWTSLKKISAAKQRGQNCLVKRGVCRI